MALQLFWTCDRLPFCHLRWLLCRSSRNEWDRTLWRWVCVFHVHWILLSRWLFARFVPIVVWALFLLCFELRSPMHVLPKLILNRLTLMIVEVEIGCFVLFCHALLVYYAFQWFVSSYSSVVIYYRSVVLGWFLWEWCCTLQVLRYGTKQLEVEPGASPDAGALKASIQIERSV